MDEVVRDVPEKKKPERLETFWTDVTRNRYILQLLLYLGKKSCQSQKTCILGDFKFG